MFLSKVSQLDPCYYIFSHDDGLNSKTFDEGMNYFEILIE